MTTHQMKALMIEDFYELYDLVKDCLNGICDVAHASTLADANQMLTESPYDIILSDIVLTDGKVFSLFEKLSKEGIILPRIIFFSAYDEIENKLESFATGGVDFITKPFDPRELRIRVRHQLNTVKSL